MIKAREWFAKKLGDSFYIYCVVANRGQFLDLNSIWLECVVGPGYVEPVGDWIDTQVDVQALRGEVRAY